MKIVVAILNALKTKSKVSKRNFSFLLGQPLGIVSMIPFAVVSL